MNRVIDISCPGANLDADKALVNERFALPNDGKVRLLAFDPLKFAEDAYDVLNKVNKVTVENDNPSVPLNCPRFENGTCRTLIPTERIQRPFELHALTPVGGFPPAHKHEVVRHICTVADRIKNATK